MINQKPEIYKTLKSLGYPVAQQSDNVFNTLPALTYYISSDKVAVDLNADLTSQTTSVSIDIWANTSVEASRILGELELAMRKKHWRLANSLDLPNPDKTIYHTNATFERLIGVI